MMLCGRYQKRLSHGAIILVTTEVFIIREVQMMRWNPEGITDSLTFHVDRKKSKSFVRCQALCITTTTKITGPVSMVRGSASWPVKRNFLEYDGDNSGFSSEKW